MGTAGTGLSPADNHIPGLCRPQTTGVFRSSQQCQSCFLPTEQFEQFWVNGPCQCCNPLSSSLFVCGELSFQTVCKCSEKFAQKVCKWVYLCLRISTPLRADQSSFGSLVYSKFSSLETIRNQSGLYRSFEPFQGNGGEMVNIHHHLYASIHIREFANF